MNLNISTTDYNKCNENIVDNNIKSKNLVAKSANSLDLNKKVATLATKI